MLRLILAISLLWAPEIRAVQSVTPTANEFQSAYDQLRKLSPRLDRSTLVTNLVIRRDAAEFRLESGTMQLLTPVDGRTIGAVFHGKGFVTVRPPIPMERVEMLRVLKDSIVSSPISVAVFLFTDSTAAELEHRLRFSAGSSLPGASEMIGPALDFLVEDRLGWVEPALMTPLLNGNSNGFFAGYVRRLAGEDLMFQSNPYEREESLLLRRGKFPGQRVQVVSQFQRAEDVADSSATKEERLEPLQLESYRIESTIKENLAFSAVATVRLRGRQNGDQWARFTLFDELRVDSVTNELGATLPFVRPKLSRELWIRVGDASAFRANYHGSLIIWREGWTFIKSSSEWFPRYGDSQAADMELVYHTPTSFRLASIGKRVESRVVGKVETSTWATEAPARQASFNIGTFEESEINDPRIPPVSVQVNDAAHRALNTLHRMRDPQSEVGSDVANSLAFFTRMFGQPLFSRYYATEIPYGHGQAFPGLIHLSWVTFSRVREDGTDEVFRAHEMAHQWWGIGVTPADYRDAWLAEGLSDFAGMWYMQLILKDNEKYFNLLEKSGKEIRRVRNDAPPIAMGYRIPQVEPEHYSTQVYQKGAWVVHMLRNMMMDFRTMSEDRFGAMMGDFYTSHRGRLASTRDFQAVVEKHFGLSMEWFFNQWVRGTAVPTYTLSWQAEPAAGGKHLLRFRVRQEHVPDDFFMPVPLLIEFPDSGRATIRVNMRGAKVEGELMVPGRPLRLVLNPLQSVLAEIKEEAWR